MRRRTLARAASLGALAATAAYFCVGNAQASDEYIAIRGSFAVSDGARATVVYIPVKATFSNGGGGSLVIGSKSDWLGVRLEIEGLYRGFSTKALVSGGARLPVSGRVNVFAPMVNAIFDVPVPDAFPVKPFVGIGIGGIYADVRPPANSVALVDDGGWGFGYQAMLGANVPMTERSSFTAQLRYLASPGVPLHAVGGLPFDANFSTESVDLGFQYNL
ncbi:MAG: hypothetical protein WDM86_20960 [Rhizomicrobium sp.]